jgi:hypothetical protein
MKFCQAMVSWRSDDAQALTLTCPTSHVTRTDGNHDADLEVSPRVAELDDKRTPISKSIASEAVQPLVLVCQASRVESFGCLFQRIAGRVRCCVVQVHEPRVPPMEFR